MKAIIFLFLSIISGFLFLSPWFLDISGLIPLVSLVPFLWAEDYFSSSNKHKYLKVFGCAFVCFMTISLSSTLWLTKLLTYWAIIYFVVNSLLYSTVCLLFSFIKSKLGKKLGYASFVIIFTAFEYIYYNMNIAFPTIIGGVSVFNGDAWNIQWYEYTGVLGGTVWVLTSNVLFFLLSKTIINKEPRKHIVKWGASAVAVAAIPALISLAMYKNYEEKAVCSAKTSIVQPNIDPYTVKFNTDRDSQLSKMIHMADIATDSTVDFIIFPETAIAGNIWENNIIENPMVLKIHNDIINYHKNATCITGAEMMRYYIKGVDAEIPSSARLADGSDNIYYEMYNSALAISNSDVQVYKKGKLVLGTEYLPFMELSPDFATYIMSKFGHGNISYGKQKEPTVFNSNGFCYGTAICFESLFGEHCSKFSKLGAGALFVITNDGWWNGTIGPEQHKRFSQIRAVENRKDVVRCGNTGFSVFINQQGDIISQAPWWTECTLNGTVNFTYETTFYSKHGDWIGVLALMLCLAFPAVAVKKRFSKPAVKGKKKKK